MIRRKRKSKKDKTPRELQIDRADQLFREIIYMRDGKQCQLAGRDNVNCGGGIQCAHIITRARYRIRWEPMNAMCLCQGHHWYYTNNNHVWFPLVERLFPEMWKTVDLLKHLPGSTKKLDLELLILNLEQIHKQLTGA